jgi:uncharacterized membrane protein
MSDLGPAALRGAETLGRHDPFWPAQFTVLAAIVLSLDLPSSLTVRQVWLIPSAEAVLLAALVATTPWIPARRHHQRRKVAMVLIGLVTASNLINLALLVHVLLHGLHGHSVQGEQLLLAGAEIWITNVLLFTVWYWELDRGGPMARKLEPLPAPDFLFPQMTEPKLGGIEWRASYLDYLYTSFTNATAFSPTDTMPLTATAKVIMGIQSLVSLVTLGLVVSRAVNILT